MTTLQPQVFNQSFEKTDDIPDYISIYERPKLQRGRPKTCTLTDEEKLERLKLNYKNCDYANPDKEIARKQRERALKKREEQKIKEKHIHFLTL